MCLNRAKMTRVEWSALIGFAGVALGWLVAWLQQQSSRRDAARVRRDDRQARAEEWLRNARLVEYSALLPLLRGLPTPEHLLALSKAEARARIEAAVLAIDQQLAKLGLLVDRGSAQPGIRVQAAALEYVEAVIALPEPWAESAVNAHADMVDRYTKYEDAWGDFVEVLRLELGVHPADP